MAERRIKLARRIRPAIVSTRTHSRSKAPYVARQELEARHLRVHDIQHLRRTKPEKVKAPAMPVRATAAFTKTGSAERPQTARPETENKSATSGSKWHIPSFAFTAISLLFMLVPTISMALPVERFTDPSSDTQIEFPALKTDTGTLNTRFLPEAGDYFEARFPARGALISAAGQAEASLLGTSATNQVVIGTDGYLFYAGTLDDYLGRNQLSERGIENAATNLRILQDALAEQEIDFAVAIAPNKNTLYGEYMPARYRAADRDESNLTRLQEAFDKHDVNYIDLEKLMRSSDEVRYLKTDTHWDSRGAYSAAEMILKQLGVENEAPNPQWQPGNSITGDIAKMLDPSTNTTETDWQAPGLNDGENHTGKLWTYGGAETPGDADVTANLIATGGVGENNLFMFRDSFGNAMIPMLSPSFRAAYYSKLIPYDISYALLQHPDAVVIERAERHAAFFATDPPAMSAPSASLTGYELRRTFPETVPELRVQDAGSYKVVNGVIPKRYQRNDSEVLMRVSSFGEGPADTQVRDYRAFRVSTPAGSNQTATDYGYRFYVDAQMLANANRVEIYVTSKDFNNVAFLLNEVSALADTQQ